MHIMRNLIYLSTILICLITPNITFAKDLKKSKALIKKTIIKPVKPIIRHEDINAIESFNKAQSFFEKPNEATFEEITNFIIHHQDWPQKIELLTLAEKRLNSNTNKTKIVRWFSNNKPILPQGYYYFFKAAIELVREPSMLKKIINDAWIFADFDYEESKLIYNKYINEIDQESHYKKIDNLLWQQRITEATNLFPLIKDKNYLDIYHTWIAIIKGKHKIEETKFHHLKGSYRYHSGLLYTYLKLHQKNEPNEELIRLYQHAEIDPDHAEEWWKLKHYFARELIKLKKYNVAYKIVAKHNLSKNGDIVEAEWLSGWLMFRYLNNSDAAITHFEKIYHLSKSAISIARGAYWLGRCYDKLGRKEISQKWYQDAAYYGYTFYGQLAQNELGYKKLNLSESTKISNAKYNKKINKYGKIAIYLASNDRFDLAKLYAKEAFLNAECNEEIREIFFKLSPYFNIYQNTEMAKLAQQAGCLILKYSYPTPYKIPSNADENLVYSLIRQESVFNQNALSSANAYGLMQIIPSTCKAVAQSLKMHCDLRKLTKDPNYNIKLGSSYIHSVINNFDGSYIMAIAGYNGGPHNLPKWTEIYGDPRNMKLYHVIDWLESIPFYETRNYVQRVVENIEVYKYILNKNSKLTIKDILQK